MKSSAAVTGYIAVLLIVGFGMAIVGTLLPLGGGLTVALLGAASLGAGLVLVGVRMIGAQR